MGALVLAQLADVDHQRGGRSAAVDLRRELVDREAASGLERRVALAPARKSASEVAHDAPGRSGGPGGSRRPNPKVARARARRAGRGRRPSPATSRRTSPPGSTASPGCGSSRGPAVIVGRSPGLRLRSPLEPRRRRGAGLRHLTAEEPRAGLVRRPHPGEVARERRLAGQQDRRERVDVRGADHRVVASLVADGR